MKNKKYTREIWLSNFELMTTPKDKYKFCEINYKYKYLAVKRKHLKRYIGLKYGTKEASKIK